MPTASRTRLTPRGSAGPPPAGPREHGGPERASRTPPAPATDPRHGGHYLGADRAFQVRAVVHVLDHEALESRGLVLPRLGDDALDDRVQAEPGLGRARERR